MANYLCVFPASDSHIDFIREHPKTLWQYVQGNPPELPETATPKATLWQRITGSAPVASPPPTTPGDWPTEERAPIGPEINHRNVDLHHLILNGTADPVEGSGTIFQTWVVVGNHAAIDLTGQNEHFAFKSPQIPSLAELLSKIDATSVKTRFTQWLRSQGDSYQPSEEECEDIAKEYKAFAEAARSVAQNHQGLIWVSS